MTNPLPKEKFILERVMKVLQTITYVPRMDRPWVEKIGSDLYAKQLLKEVDESNLKLYGYVKRMVNAKLETDSSNETSKAKYW